MEIFYNFVFCCSTKRIDNSNCRLVSQVDKETGKMTELEAAFYFTRQHK